MEYLKRKPCKYYSGKKEKSRLNMTYSFHPTKGAFIEDWFVLTICENVSAEMSKGNESYFAMTCHGPDVPWSCLHKTDTGELVAVYEHNADLVAKVGSYDLPQPDWMSFNVTNSDQKVSFSSILHIFCHR